MIDAGADIIGDPSQSHCVAIDARAPLYDGGICTRVDCVSLGWWSTAMPCAFMMRGKISGLNATPSGADWSPTSPDRSATRSSTAKPSATLCPVFPGAQANTIAELAASWGLDGERLAQTIADYNAACAPGQFDHTRRITARPLASRRRKLTGRAPSIRRLTHGYALRPGITFTYLGLYVDDTAAVHFAGQPSRNLFVAGEMMAGNVLGRATPPALGCRSAPPSAVSPASKPPGRRSRRNTMKSLEKLIIDAQIITEPGGGSRTGDAGVTPAATAKGFAPSSRR